MSINGTQSVSFEKGTIEFKNYFRQILISFKLYANFECNLWVSVSVSVESYEGSYSKTYQDHIPCSFACKLLCVDDEFTKLIVTFRGKNTAYELVKAILKECQYYKKEMKKHLNKSLIMSEGKEQFQSSNICWICEKLIYNNDEKVRDHCHITREFRGAAHWSCNINLQLTKKSSCNISQFKRLWQSFVFWWA